MITVYYRGSWYDVNLPDNRSWYELDRNQQLEQLRINSIKQDIRWMSYGYISGSGILDVEGE